MPLKVFSPPKFAYTVPVSSMTPVPVFAAPSSPRLVCFEIPRRPWPDHGFFISVTGAPAPWWFRIVGSELRSGPKWNTNNWLWLSPLGSDIPETVPCPPINHGASVLLEISESTWNCMLEVFPHTFPVFQTRMLRDGWAIWSNTIAESTDTTCQVFAFVSPVLLTLSNDEPRTNLALFFTTMPAALNSSCFTSIFGICCLIALEKNRREHANLVVEQPPSIVPC